jgi:glutaryl-CoA dehydrogenase
MSLSTDLAAIDTLLMDEERAVRARVRSWVEEAGVAETMLRHWEAATFPYELLPGLGALGVAGGPLRGHGCAGWSNVAYGLALAELARASGSLSTTVHVQSGLAMTAIWMHGSEEQKQRWLPPMSRFEAIGAFAATEPEAGSDLASLATTATAVPGGFSLRGEKRWIGHGSVCDAAVVWARNDEGRSTASWSRRGRPAGAPRSSPARVRSAPSGRPTSRCATASCRRRTACRGPAGWATSCAC